MATSPPPASSSDSDDDAAASKARRTMIEEATLCVAQKQQLQPSTSTSAGAPRDKRDGTSRKRRTEEGGKVSEGSQRYIAQQLEKLLDSQIKYVRPKAGAGARGNTAAQADVGIRLFADSTQPVREVEATAAAGDRKRPTVHASSKADESKRKRIVQEAAVSADSILANAAFQPQL